MNEKSKMPLCADLRQRVLSILVVVLNACAMLGLLVIPRDGLKDDWLRLPWEERFWRFFGELPSWLGLIFAIGFLGLLLSGVAHLIAILEPKKPTRFFVRALALHASLRFVSDLTILIRFVPLSFRCLHPPALLALGGGLASLTSIWLQVVFIARHRRVPEPPLLVRSVWGPLLLVGLITGCVIVAAIARMEPANGNLVAFARKTESLVIGGVWGQRHRPSGPHRPVLLVIKIHDLPRTVLEDDGSLLRERCSLTVGKKRSPFDLSWRESVSYIDGRMPEQTSYFLVAAVPRYTRSAMLHIGEHPSIRVRTSLWIRPSIEQ